MKDYRNELEKKIEAFLSNGEPHPKNPKHFQTDTSKSNLDNNVDAYISVLKSRGKSSEVIETDTYKSLQSAAITPSGSLLDTESGIEMICNHSLRLLAQSTPFKLWTLQAKKFLDLSETALLAVYESYRK